MEWIGYIGIGILVLLVLLVLVTNIQIVQQSRAYVVERWHTAAGPGSPSS